MRPFNEQAFEDFVVSGKKLIIQNIIWKPVLESSNARNAHRCSAMHVGFAFMTPVNTKTEQWH